MKKTTKQEDTSNFVKGVSSGFGAMKNRVGFTILGILVGLVCGFKWANYNYRAVQGAEEGKRIEEAKKNVTNEPAAAAGQMPGQIMEVIKKAKENPNDFDSQRKAAELYMQVRRPEGALPFLEQANKLKPEDGEVMAELAGAHFFKGNYPDSVTWARKAIAKDAGSRPAKFYLASSLILSKQNLDEAEKLLNQVEADTQNAPDDAKQVLSGMRERLREARGGGAATEKPAAPAGSDAKTSLQHGPDAGGKK